MRIRLLLQFVLITSLCHSALAQNIRRDTIVHMKDGKPDSFYITLLPQKGVKGLLVILPGFGMPADVFKESSLAEKAANSGYAVCVPFLGRIDRPDTSGTFMHKLAAMVPEVVKAYNLPSGKFIIGGHSFAGHQAMLYAERSFQPGYGHYVKPNAVFGVDPPLDLKRLYNGYVRSMQLEPAKAKGSEGEFITGLFNATFGGDPASRPLAYEAASSFYRDAPNGGNAKFLTSIPVRLYSDPDLQWFIKERNWPVEWTNTSDITACIVQLRLLGNKQAEYIACLGKGFTADGKRHPHAFSMLDADEFVHWADGLLGVNQKAKRLPIPIQK